METDRSMQRRWFVAPYLSGDWTMSELCEHFGTSRPTGYLWVNRYDKQDEAWCRDKSRAPLEHPNATDPGLEFEILRAKRKLKYGAKKFRWHLQRTYPHANWPSVSTLNAILDRHGLVRKRRHHNKYLHPGGVPLETDRPNQVSPIDFKSHFKMRDGQYCYPLTVTDHYSRSLLACHGLESTKGEGVKPSLEKLFREVGLPEAIRSDNGAPFASGGLHGLCALPVWWMQLGIVHQRIHPRSPQENGQHERMHRELKAETARPARSNMESQQQAFDEFRHRYNEQRPHEALDGAVPADRWEPSPRPMPDRILAPEYPSHFEVRKVSGCGAIRLNSHQQDITEALIGEYVGLEEVEDGIWDIVYYSTLIGRFNQRDGTLSGIQRAKDVPGQL